MLPIIYADDDVVAVHKPAGLKMHRDSHDGPATDTLLRTVRDQTGRWVYPVHRLDRPVSGVVLFAFAKETARSLAAAFRERQVGKTYLAVARGHLEESGCIDSPLTPHAHSPKAGQVPIAALTHFRCLAKTELQFPLGPYDTCRYSLAAVYPRTGRMHQIRRHFHHIRHPLIGDTVYGDGRHNRFFRDRLECRRLLLAAVELHLAHPRSGESLDLIAPLETSFERVLERLGWLGLLPPKWRFAGSGAPACDDKQAKGSINF